MPLQKTTRLLHPRNSRLPVRGIYCARINADLPTNCCLPSQSPPFSLRTASNKLRYSAVAKPVAFASCKVWKSFFSSFGVVCLPVPVVLGECTSVGCGCARLPPAAKIANKRPCPVDVYTEKQRATVGCRVRLPGTGQTRQWHRTVGNLPPPLCVCVCVFVCLPKMKS